LDDCARRPKRPISGSRRTDAGGTAIFATAVAKARLVALHYMHPEAGFHASTLCLLLLFLGVLLDVGLRQ